MTRTNRWLLSIAAIAAVTLFTPLRSSQAQVQNVVDFDFQIILQCSDFTLDDDELGICTFVMADVVNDLLEAEAFIDQVFAGYRLDMPSFFRNQLADSITVFFNYSNEDVGGVLATGAPYFEDPNNPLDDDFGIVAFIPNPFLQNRRGIRPWVLGRAGTVNIDIQDAAMLVFTDTMVDVIVHEVFHALGHPTLFEFSQLNRQTGIVNNAVNFIGDDGGINGAGYGLTEFRAESANPFATFIPLSQNDTTGAGGHLSSFEPTFNRPFEGLQEVFLPTAPGPGVQAFMSRSLRGMFADLGFLMRGINLPGIVDIDLDGADDVPLLVNPRLPRDTIGPFN